MKGIGDVENGLYVLKMQELLHGNANNIKTMSAANKVVDPVLWHMRLGHILMGVLRRIKDFQNCNRFTLEQCSIYPQARQTIVPFPTRNDTADEIFYLVHMDV